MFERLLVKSRFRDYEVHFTDRFTDSLALQRDSSFFIVDEHVMEIYQDELELTVPKGRLILVEAKESHKTLDYCQSLIRILIERNIRRSHTLIAIGGGVLQDIAGFIASILYRGIRWVFYPTTLLAQADSCIGSKCSINLDGYKNLLGSFCPPTQIFIDTHFLQTLPVEEIKSGIGEILHFYLIADNGRIVGLTNNYDKLIKNPMDLIEHICASLEIKKKMIEIDEFDENERRIFNYGHTFGHAIETVSNYSINHGQAVTKGMDIANYLSHSLGYLDEKTFYSLSEALEKNMPEFGLTAEILKNFFRILSKDKKNLDTNLSCVLTHGPGQMFITKVPLDDSFKEMIARYFGISLESKLTP